MHNSNKAMDIYDELKREDPSLDTKMVKHFADKMPKEFARTMYEMKHGCHIYDEDTYNEAVSYLKWADEKGHGAKWDVDTLTKLSGIDFEKSKFTEYDYAYVANMLYSDYCNIFTDTTYYLKMAKMYLTDTDYPGKADERAYKSAMKRIDYYEKE